MVPIKKLGWPWITLEVITPPSEVGPCGRGVPLRKAIDMSENLHLTIGYLYD
jgi:hypothetical protein